MTNVVDYLGNSYRSISDMLNEYNISYSAYANLRSKGLSDAEITEKASAEMEESTDHTGVRYKSISEMCSHWGVNVKTYKRRLRYGYTKQQALEKGYGNCTEYDRTDHNGRVFNSIKEMCEAYGISTNTYSMRLKRGLTKGEALTNKIKQRGTEDHLGNTYSSITKMCSAYNIPESRYKTRLEHGFSKSDALTTEKIYKASIEDRTDHLGNVYESMRDMCSAYGISVSTYDTRIESGLTKEEAFTREVRIQNERADINTRTDIDGTVYDTVSELCRMYRIDADVYMLRLQSGWDKQSALEIPVAKIKRNKDIEKVTDHNGNVYDTVKDMCKANGVSVRSYYKKLKAGKTKEEALTKTVRRKAPEELRTGLDGTVYSTIKEMAQHYGLSDAVYKNRLNLGWSKEEALTKKLKYKGKGIDKTDHLGTVYKTAGDMCKAYGVRYDTYRTRLKLGWSKEDALKGKLNEVSTGRKKNRPLRQGV